MLPHYQLELAIKGNVAGTDEAGRAPLAGPVTAAAVILNPHSIPDGINDSKKLSEKARNRLAQEIKESALAWAVCECDLNEIERLNILHASMEAMRKAVAALSITPNHVLVDGNRIPPQLICGASTIIKGDSISLSIAAASILAKTARDAVMKKLAADYPGYGWEKNAGYPTPQHLAALDKLGVTPHHRVSFAPVRNHLMKASA